MKAWVRYEQDGETGFGLMEGDTIVVHAGSMFENPVPAGKTVSRADVRLLMPCVPSKMIMLWNNFHAQASRLGVPLPSAPLYVLKPANAYIGDGDTVKRPKSYDGKIVYEGELGIVIGKRCKDVTVAEAPEYIFGYTCCNDITAAELIQKDRSFPQWVRAKGFDTFGIFGPGIATDVDFDSLIVQTFVNGEERQNYSVRDMIFTPRQLVSMISGYMTLEPGDVISCGTSLGVGSLRDGNVIEVVIEGVGRLANRYED